MSGDVTGSRPGSTPESAVIEIASELAGKSVDDQAVVAIGAHSGLWFTNITPRWAADLEALELASYPTADPQDLYSEASLRALATDFPEGCFAGFDSTDNNRLVAMGLGLRVQFDLSQPQHTIDDIVPHDPDRSGHDPEGPWYYGSGISVHIEYRRRGIGRELYQLRKSVCSQHNLRGIVAGGVMPGYADHRDSMSADEYIGKVAAGELYDPTLTFQQGNGFVLGPALPGYITDPAVNDYASLIVWHNPTFDQTA